MPVFSSVSVAIAMDARPLRDHLVGAQWPGHHGGGKPWQRRRHRPRSRRPRSAVPPPRITQPEAPPRPVQPPRGICGGVRRRIR
eukprot:scaffold15020_cov124-Isochrysis_galbana.AAC.1